MDIVSDAEQIHIGHFSSYIGHINYKMIINSHLTSDIMSDLFCTYVGHSGANVGHVRRVRRFLGYTGVHHRHSNSVDNSNIVQS